MIAKLFVLGLLAVGSTFAQLSIGVRIGAPPPMRVMRNQPRSPGADYSWIAGYWYPEGRRYKWHNGYWTRPSYVGARWVAPRHDGQSYYAGYWEGDRGQKGHDHGWDRNRDHNRDYDRDRNNR